MISHQLSGLNVRWIFSDVKGLAFLLPSRAIKISGVRTEPRTKSGWSIRWNAILPICQINMLRESRSRTLTQVIRYGNSVLKFIWSAAPTILMSACCPSFVLTKVEVNIATGRKDRRNWDWKDSRKINCQTFQESPGIMLGTTRLYEHFDGCPGVADQYAETTEAFSISAARLTTEGYIEFWLISHLAEHFATFPPDWRLNGRKW